VYHIKKPDDKGLRDMMFETRVTVSEHFLARAVRGSATCKDDSAINIVNGQIKGFEKAHIVAEKHLHEQLWLWSQMVTKKKVIPGQPRPKETSKMFPAKKG